MREVGAGILIIKYNSPGTIFQLPSTWKIEGLWAGSHTGLGLTNQWHVKAVAYKLESSAHLSGDCHPATPAFKIQQTVWVGFKDESQNQCKKHTAVVEKHGVENRLLSACYKHNLYKRECQGRQRREDAFPRLGNRVFEQEGKTSDTARVQIQQGAPCLEHLYDLVFTHAGFST